ncbi:hypothetical protein, partial [Duncaniella freteri]|uniref:hypothetical protein n=1 Tax=Duncaniella freteri TaxID=2530391 RepID=UPI00258D19DD
SCRLSSRTTGRNATSRLSPTAPTRVRQEARLTACASQKHPPPLRISKPCATSHKGNKTVHIQGSKQPTQKPCAHIGLIQCGRGLCMSVDVL